MPRDTREGTAWHVNLESGGTFISSQWWKTRSLALSIVCCRGNLGFPEFVAHANNMRASLPREGVRRGFGPAVHSGISYVRCCLCRNPVTATASLWRGKRTGSDQSEPTAQPCVCLFVCFNEGDDKIGVLPLIPPAADVSVIELLVEQLMGKWVGENSS